MQKLLKIVNFVILKNVQIFKLRFKNYLNAITFKILTQLEKLFEIY